MMPTFGTSPTLPSGIAYTWSDTFVVTPSFTSGGAGAAGGCTTAIAAVIDTTKRAVTSGRSMLAHLLLSFRASHFTAQLLEQSFVADDEQRLRRRLQEIEKRAACRTRVDVV